MKCTTDKIRLILAPDAKTNQAKKFIRKLRADSRMRNSQNAAETILIMPDKGTITNLPAELRKLRIKV